MYIYICIYIYVHIYILHIYTIYAYIYMYIYLPNPDQQQQAQHDTQTDGDFTWILAAPTDFSPSLWALPPARNPPAPLPALPAPPPAPLPALPPATSTTVTTVTHNPQCSWTGGYNLSCAILDGWEAQNLQLHDGTDYYSYYRLLSSMVSVLFR